MYEDLIRQIFHTDAIKFEDHRLTNGKILPVYIDLRQIFAFPEVHHLVANEVWLKIKTLDFNYLCGLPYGAIPLVSAIAFTKNQPMVLLRKESKEHGTQKIIDGKMQADDKILLIDDFVSSGTTLISAIRILKAHKLQINDVVVFIDSQLGGSDLVKSNNINVHSVMTLMNFYQTLKKSVKLTNVQEKRIDKLLATIQLRSAQPI